MIDLKEWLESISPVVENADEDIDKSPKYKLDLFNQVLPAIDRKDYYFYKNLTDDERTDLDTWMLMRWVSSLEYDSDMAQQIILINEIVNNNFTALSPKKMAGLSGHKELQWMLLASCGTKKRSRRKFIKPAKGATKNKLEEEIIKIFPHYKQEDIDLFLSINSTEDLVDLFRDNGYDDKLIDEVFRKNAKNK